MKRYNNLTTILGQKFEPNHTSNKANHNRYWTFDVYDFRSWYDGFCHTFNPLETQPFDKGYNLDLYLGHLKLFNDHLRTNKMFDYWNLVRQFYTKVNFFNGQPPRVLKFG